MDCLEKGLRRSQFNSFTVIPDQKGFCRVRRSKSDRKEIKTLKTLVWHLLREPMKEMSNIYNKMNKQ